MTDAPMGPVSIRGDGKVEWQEPYFVSPHAIQRYRERVDRRVSDQEIIHHVQEGLQGVAPCYPPSGRPLAIADRARTFVAIIAPIERSPGEWPTVMTIWRWGTCPILLKRRDGRGRGRRHYRWLNGQFPGSDQFAGGSGD